MGEFKADTRSLLLHPPLATPRMPDQGRIGFFMREYDGSRLSPARILVDDVNGPDPKNKKLTEEFEEIRDKLQTLEGIQVRRRSQPWLSVNE